MIIKCAWVVPITSPPIRDGYVEIEADRIISVGSVCALCQAATEVVDLGFEIALE